MATDIISIIKAVPDRQPATVTVTDSIGRRTELSCIYKVSDAPSLFLLFPPDTLPANLDKDTPCLIVSEDALGQTVTFSATIVDLPNNRVMELEGRKAVRPEDLREYFRVNISAQVEVSYEPEQSNPDEEPLELEGETVDLSQTGVLTILSDECRIKKPVTLELNLPNPAETIICSARVIRSKRLRKNRWLTAFQFDNISGRARDIIAKNCFAEQRRQLREKVQTAG